MTERRKFRPPKICLIWADAGLDGPAMGKRRGPGRHGAPKRSVKAEENQSMGLPPTEGMGMTMG